MKFVILFLLALALNVSIVIANTSQIGSSEQDVSREAPPFHFFQKNTCYMGQECFTYQSGEQFEFSDYLGFYHKRNFKFREIRRTEGQVLFDVTYELDQYGRRKTALQNQGQEFFAIFFGCSFTFGTGVDVDETLPSQLARQDSRFEAYNYGMNGVGTNTMLAQSEYNEFAIEVKQKKGIIVYNYIEDHVYRATARIPSLTWLKDTPFYNTDPVEFAGSLSSANPFWVRGLLILAKWFPALAGKRFPPIGERDYEYVCELIKQTKENMLAQFPGSLFLLVKHPLEGFALNSALKSCLEKAEVVVREPLVLTAPKYKIPVDGHPNSVANELLAKDILQTIEDLSFK